MGECLPHTKGGSAAQLQPIVGTRGITNSAVTQWGQKLQFKTKVPIFMFSFLTFKYHVDQTKYIHGIDSAPEASSLCPLLLSYRGSSWDGFSSSDSHVLSASIASRCPLDS